MKQILTALALFLFQFAMVPCAQAQFGSPPILTALVQATITQNEKEDGGIRTTFKITHVFSGEPTLVGKTFSGWTWTSSHSASLMQVGSDAKVGENGIWPLSNQSGDLGSSGYSLYNMRVLDYPFPARENISSRYEQAKAVAQAIEQVERLPLSEQTTLLHRLVFDPTPEVSAWAIGRLSRNQPQENNNFLRDLLPNPKLSIQALLVVDDRLDRSDKTWRDSAERISLWERCLEAKDEKLVQVVLNATNNAIARSKMDGESLYKPLRKAIQNESLSARDKDFTLALVRALFDRGLLEKRLDR